jgi:WhiB family redox-sensing transcriptional regulator
MASIARLPKPLIDSYEWQYEGACHEADPETFFSPESERGPRRRAREAAAKSYCGRCPVIDECLQHALKVREPYGVWGGLNTGERENLIARAQPVAAAS